MCDNHKHESWITPESSKHLTAKMVILPPGHSMAAHSTGSGREEVIVVLHGTVVLHIGEEFRQLFFGDTAFIPEDTVHGVHNRSEEGAGYVFVVTKKGGA